jgi:hypothetical protein
MDDTSKDQKGKATNRRRLVTLAAGVGLLLFLIIVAIALVVLYGWPVGTTDRDGLPKQASSELMQVGTAVDYFKTKMNVRYIPCSGGGPGGTFRLRAVYAGTEPEAVYLKSLFPYMNLTRTELPDRDLDPNQTLVLFLTGGPVTDYTGFSLRKDYPFTKGGDRLGPFLDLPASRFDGDGRLLDPWGTPLAYFAFDQSDGAYPDVTFSWDGFTVAPYSLAEKKVRPKSYQIISAGKDLRFGPGGPWTPGQGAWAAGEPGADDLSNFNEGPLLLQK